MERGRHLITELAATTNISYKKALCIRIRPFNLRHTSPPVAPFWDQVKAGCYVDSQATDYATQAGCSSAGQRIASPAAIVFSVGNVFDPYPVESWRINEPGASVVWSGDCVGNNSQCTVKGTCTYNGKDPIPICPALGTKRATATVSYNGEVRIFTVSGHDLTKQNGTPEQ